MTEGRCADVIRTRLRAAGIRPLARAMGLPSPQRVWKWAEGGRVPPRSRPGVNAALVALGHPPITDDQHAAADQEHTT